jgi:exodeoxyribonuclease V beta subunit
MQIYEYPPILDDIPLNEHAVIEASAGTGKTYTIEHLVVDRLLRTPAKINEILVVTFTDKATSELRKRIRDLIENILREPTVIDDDLILVENPHMDQKLKYQGKSYWHIDIEAQRKLERTLFAFDQAAIYTIHAFCRKILVDLAFDSGQLFEQELVESRRAFHQAWQKTIRHEIANKQENRDAINLWLQYHDDLNALETLLFDAYRQGYLNHQQPFSYEVTMTMKSVLKNWKTKEMKKVYEEFAIRQDSREEALACINQIDELFGLSMTIDQKYKQLMTLGIQALIQPKKVNAKKKKFPTDLEPEIKDILQRLAHLRLLYEMENAIERQVVDQLLPVVSHHLTVDKRKEGQLDYDDLLKCVWQALNSIQGPHLIVALRNRFRYALIDEFQDTDPIQWKIFKQVFVDHKSDEHAIYIIGDPKQAIYTFRGADVHTYLNARYELTKLGAPRVPLTMNYRSTQKMINAINLILDQKGENPIFQGQIQYSEPVGCGKPHLKLVNAKGEEEPPITLWRFKPPPPSHYGPKMEVGSTMLKHVYQKQLAISLSKLLKDPAHQLMIQDGDKLRHIQASDVLILVRENREALEVASILREYEIPFTLYKPEGLLQGKEAQEIYSMLAAIVNPHDKGLRLKAFTTAFIGISWFEIFHYGDLPPGHPLLLQMFEYHQLAMQGKYSSLFHRLLHQSGLSERELFFAESEREITNYQHIFEILLQITAQHKCTPAELLTLLGKFIQGLEAPPNSEDNIQRLYSDRQMVQVMTIHKSKGLEAPVIFLYGGFSQPKEHDVNIVHDPDEGRKVLIGVHAKQSVAQKIQEEQKQEDQRLLYVALTRAQVKLFIPFVDSTRMIKGSYHQLKERLKSMCDGDLFKSEFLVEEIQEDRNQNRSWDTQPLHTWQAPQAMLETIDHEDEKQAILKRHAPLEITSYTRLKQENAGKSFKNIEMTKDEFYRDDASIAEAVGEDETDLPGGRQIGQFLHSIIEEIEMMSFKKGKTFEDWTNQSLVQTLFEEIMRRYDIDQKWMRASQNLVYYTLTSTIKIPAVKLPPLWKTKHLIEMEFIYSIPESAHPKLTESFVFDLNLSKNIYQQKKAFKVERGFVKGFIDFIFEYQNQIYFLDWKSDQCAQYDEKTLKRHVQENYDLQAKLYMIAIIRWLGIKTEEDYQKRFGGFLYLFLRAFKSQREGMDGVYFERPTWIDVLQYEHLLSQMISQK